MAFGKPRLRISNRNNSNRRRNRRILLKHVPEGPQEAPPKPAQPAQQPTHQPAQPRLQQRAQQPPRATRPGQPPENIIEAIEFRGARRVRQDTLQALIFTKKGDRYDEESLHRDFMALWNSGRFDDIRIEREPGKEGWIIRFVVVERPVVRTIKYEGNKSVTRLRHPGPLQGHARSAWWWSRSTIRTKCSAPRTS